MDALAVLGKLVDFAGMSKAASVLQMADSVSGGHAKEFLTYTQETLDTAFDDDTRDAAIQALDLARLNHVRLRVVLDLLGELMTKRQAIAAAWETRTEDTPEFEQVLAVVSLVATGYTRQPARVRKELLLDGMFGSFDPDLFVWGQQDVLLEDLMSARLGPDDISTLRTLQRTHSECNPNDPRMDSWERLASRDFVEMMCLDPSANNVGPRFVRHRTELYSIHTKFQLRSTTKGRRLLQLLDAGAKLRRTSVDSP